MTSNHEQEHAGYRYLMWTHFVEPGLTANQKAQADEAFAAEFESTPPIREPYDGWAKHWPTYAGAPPADTEANP